eukprot:2381734-Pyramimonas_sp.AAC.1
MWACSTGRTAPRQPWKSWVGSTDIPPGAMQHGLDQGWAGNEVRHRHSHRNVARGDDGKVARANKGK